MNNNYDKYKIVDLFSGCGGFTAGFLCFGGKAKWDVLVGIDIDEDAVNTFKTNFGIHTGKQDDLTTADPEWYLRKLKLTPMSLDYLHASPPCQDYSNNNRKNGSHSDSRYKIPLRWAQVFMPKVLTIENVHELGKAHDKEIQESLRELGYRVYRLKVDTADFGVPQHRRRLFYLAYLRSLGMRSFKLIKTHANPHECRDSQIPWVSVREAIGDLPPRVAGDKRAIFISRIDLSKQSKTLSDYACSLRSERGQIITEHFARPLDELALSRIQCLRPGQAIEHLPLDLQPKSGFRGAYGRLHPDHPSKTITTGIRGPSHGPYCHYSQERLMTFREAARLQSFPDSFLFEGSRASKATQIGNAVPPIMARLFRNISEQILTNRS